MEEREERRGEGIYKEAGRKFGIEWERWVDGEDLGEQKEVSLEAEP